jgi:hypothetical protein
MSARLRLLGAMSALVLVLAWALTAPGPGVRPEAVDVGGEREALQTHDNEGRLARPYVEHPAHTLANPVGGSGPAANRAAATESTTPAFGQPTIAGVQGNGFEEDIRVAPDGTIYTSVPGALSSNTSWLWRSDDGGKTFKWVPAAQPLTGKLPVCVGGGDTELAIDSAGRVYWNDLTLVNFTTARSDDRGRTFTPPNCTAVETTPNDRQWYALDGDPPTGGTLYLTYNIFGGGQPFNCPNGVIITANNQLVLARSPAPGTPPAAAGIHFAPSKLITGPCEEGIMGNVEVSPTTHHIFIPHPNAFRTDVRMARCEAIPFTQDPTGLSCVDKVVTTFPNSSENGGSGFKNGANFPTMAIDSAGNLFVVWQQAPVINCGSAGSGCTNQGDVVGDTLMYWSSSTDEGETWTPPVQIPTPGLHQNVFAWALAGDAGRVGIAWYGSATPTQGIRGPDSTVGDYGVYYTQTLNGTDPVPTFTEPVLASERVIHRGTMFTLIGRQTGNRALGDFMQVRIGLQGEAQIAYGDSTNRTRTAKAMFVRQVGGPGLLALQPVVNGEPPPAGNAVTDVEGDARYEQLGVSSATQANLDLLGVAVAEADPNTYRVTMTVKDLASLAPDPSTGNLDPVLVWNVQWSVPSSTDPFGGKNFFAYMESAGGGAPRFFAGESARQRIGGGVGFTYPGSTAVTGAITPGVAGQPDTITIDVPKAAVSVANPIDDTLHNVTGATMTLPEPANAVPFEPTTGLGGSLFNLIDQAPAFDFAPVPPGVTGHAHTDYSGNGIAGVRDVHIDLAVGESSSAVKYDDLRTNPPGPASSNIRCTGTASSRERPAANVIQLSGTMACKTLSKARTFSLAVTDRGPNPPNADRYHMVIRNGSGVVIYDNEDNTTVGLGDLSVT